LAFKVFYETGIKLPGIKPIFPWKNTQYRKCRFLLSYFTRFCVCVLYLGSFFLLLYLYSFEQSRFRLD